jgi:hypothetical protein
MLLWRAHFIGILFCCITDRKIGTHQLLHNKSSTHACTVVRVVSVSVRKYEHKQFAIYLSDVELNFICVNTVDGLKT